MKKIYLFLFGFILFGIVGCIPIGLTQNEVKKHNAKLIEEISNFSFDTYYCTFYAYPNEDKQVEFLSVNGKLEILILTKDSIVYNTGEKELCFSYETKKTTQEEKSIQTYPYYNDIVELLHFTSSFDGSSNKSVGRRGVEEDGDLVLDEITHYYYHMVWKYSDAVEINFYVTKDTNLKKIYVMNHASQPTEEKNCIFFQLWIHFENKVESLKEKYNALIKDFHQ